MAMSDALGPTHATTAKIRTGGRAVEGARLESVYTFIAYRGFESPSVRQLQCQVVPISPAQSLAGAFLLGVQCIMVPTSLDESRASQRTIVVPIMVSLEFIP